MCEGETPSEGGVWGSGWLANEGTSVRGMETIFFGLCVCFTGNFGVRKYSAMYVFR